VTDTTCKRSGYDDTGRYKVPIVKSEPATCQVDEPEVSSSSARKLDGDFHQSASFTQGESCEPSADVHKCGHPVTGRHHVPAADQCTECRTVPGREHSAECPCGGAQAILDTHPKFRSAAEIEYGDDGMTDAEAQAALHEAVFADVLDTNTLHAHMQQTFAACLAISRKKNADYATDSDPLANFRVCQQFGVTLPQGIMVRLSDKFSRIGNLLDGRTPAVEDERLTDTIQDAVNYLAILAYALEAE
jgi:hypothetical protein